MYAIALYSAHTCLLQLLSHTMARTLVVENFIYLFLLADREDIIFNVTVTVTANDEAAMKAIDLTRLDLLITLTTQRTVQYSRT